MIHHSFSLCSIVSRLSLALHYSLTSRQESFRIAIEYEYRYNISHDIVGMKKAAFHPSLLVD
jgi:hypothetical protein